MKKVFTAPGVVPCDLLKALLEAEGIRCVLRNQHGTSLLGYGFPVPGGSALQWSWPEVWITEEDMERAKPIVDEFHRSQQEESQSKEISQPPPQRDK